MKTTKKKTKTEAGARQADGKWKKGVSGNPGGRKTLATKEVATYAGQFTKEAIDIWVSIMRNAKAPAATRVKAAELVIERYCGKPVQPVGNGDGETPFEAVLCVSADGPRTVSEEELAEVDSTLGPVVNTFVIPPEPQQDGGPQRDGR